MSVIDECEQKVEKRPLIELSCLFTNRENPSPFSQFKIDSSDFLDDVPDRSECPVCNKSRKYYCYNCYVPVGGIAKKIPFVKLPFKVDIIKHSKEVDGKSTSAHAAVLAPDDVKIYTYPNFPQYDPSKVILIFPGKSALPLQEWWTRTVQTSCGQESRCPFERVVFIDSTWKQAKQLYNDLTIKSLPCVVLTSHKSLFWRHQRGKPVNHLATVEAIYYFAIELYHLMNPDQLYCGEYDNLMFFFKFMYYKIRTLYDPKTLKAYQTQAS